jgi:hypothetical protein
MALVDPALGKFSLRVTNPATLFPLGVVEGLALLWGFIRLDLSLLFRPYFFSASFDDVRFPLFPPANSGDRIVTVRPVLLVIQ